MAKVYGRLIAKWRRSRKAIEMLQDLNNAAMVLIYVGGGMALGAALFNPANLLPAMLIWLVGSLGVWTIHKISCDMEERR